MSTPIEKNLDSGLAQPVSSTDSRVIWLTLIAVATAALTVVTVLATISLLSLSTTSGSAINELRNVSFDDVADSSSGALVDLVFRLDGVEQDYQTAKRTASITSVFVPSLSVMPNANQELSAWGVQAIRIGKDVAELSSVVKASSDLLEVFAEAQNILAGTSELGQSSGLRPHVLALRDSFELSAEGLSAAAQRGSDRKPTVRPGGLDKSFEFLNESESKLIDVSRIGRQASDLTVDLLTIGDEMSPFVNQFRDGSDDVRETFAKPLLDTMTEVREKLGFSLVKSEGLARLVAESELSTALSNRVDVLVGVQRVLLDLTAASLPAIEAAGPALLATQTDGRGILDVEGVLVQTLQAVAKQGDEFEQSTLLIAQAQETLNALKTQSDSSSFSGLDDLEAILRHLHDGFELITEVAPIASDLFGADGPRRYLVLGQSADELRATGGFVSALWVVTFENGVLQDIQYHDTVRVDDWKRLEFYPAAPRPLENHMGAQVWLLRDVSWEPDFPTSARIAADLFRLGQREEVDGIIALNQWSLLELLGAIGSIPAPEGGSPITPRNFLSKLEQGSDQYGRAYADLALQGILDQLRQPGSFGTLLKTASALHKSLQDRHLLVYLNDPDSQMTIAQSGWDGSVVESPKDYLYVVDSNVGWTKSDRNIERTVRYEVDLTKGSSTRISLKLRYNNHSGPSSPTCQPQWQNRGTNYTQLKNACYWNFWRAYVPFGARLLQHTPLGLPEHSVAVDTDQALPGEDTFSITEGFGRTVLSGLFALEAGESKNISLVYELPNNTVTKTQHSIDYSLLIQKQPGIVERGVEIEFKVPNGFRLESSSIPPSSIADSRMTFSLRVERDTLIEARFTKEDSST